MRVLLDKIIKFGELRDTRNAQTYSLFGEKLVFNLQNGFPLLTTKKIFVRGIIEELLFFTLFLCISFLVKYYDPITNLYILSYNFLTPSNLHKLPIKSIRLTGSCFIFLIASDT